MRWPRESAERKVISLSARIDKLDLEPAIHDRVRLSNELVKPWFDYRAVALEIGISTVSGVRRLSIDRYAKSQGSSSRCWPHHEIEITRMEAERNSPSGLIQRNDLFSDRPIAGKRPVVQAQLRGLNVNVMLIPCGATGRCKVVGLPIADVGLRSPQVAQIRGNFGATGVDRNRFGVESATPGLG